MTMDETKNPGPDRAEAIKTMVEEAKRVSHESGDTINIVVCQGPPACLQMAAGQDPETIQSDCHWCDRITVHPDGSVFWKQFPRA